jgi:hypothetical protein
MHRYIAGLFAALALFWAAHHVSPHSVVSTVYDHQGDAWAWTQERHQVDQIDLRKT